MIGRSPRICNSYFIENIYVIQDITCNYTPWLKKLEQLIKWETGWMLAKPGPPQSTGCLVNRNAILHVAINKCNHHKET